MFKLTAPYTTVETDSGTYYKQGGEYYKTTSPYSKVPRSAVGEVTTIKAQLSTRLEGEDATLSRNLTVNAVKISSTAITTNTSTLIQSGKSVFLGAWVSNAGTSWTIQVRDNATSAAGGTNKGTAVTAAVGDPFNTFLNGKGIICDAGLVIDTAGTTPGSLLILYI